MPPTHRGLRPDEAAVLGVLAAIWGASFLFIKVGLRDFGPLGVVTIRTGLAGSALAVFVLVGRGRRGLRRLVGGVPPRRALFLALTSSALPFALISWAETTISTSLAGILNAALPLLTALLAFRLDPGNRLRGWRTIGLLVGFAGVTLVAGSDFGGSPLGVLAMLGSGVSYAVGVHYAKAHFSDVEPVGVALLQTAVSALLVFPLFLVFQPPTHVPSLAAVGSLLGLGLGGTALAWVLFYRLVATAGPQHSVAVTYLVPIFALVYGAVLLHEHVTAAAVVGMVVILVGEIVIALPGRSRTPEVGVVVADTLP